MPPPSPPDWDAAAIPGPRGAPAPVASYPHEHRHVPGLAHHFEALEQQREAGELGMWLFLVTEFMFFGGFFMAYLAYRYWYPEAFSVGGQAMNVWLGTLNTAVLLTSSFTMALAVHSAQEQNRSALVQFLLITIGLGLVFLVVKAYEYYHKFEEHLIPFGGLPFEPHGEQPPGLKEFFNIYFLMTGLHAFHMAIGLAVLATLAALARRGRLLGSDSIVVHNVGLYWHFVDLVWVYLFPFFYLIPGPA